MKFFVKKSKGFGLIETLVACAILVMICGALLTINVIVTRDIVFARERTVAFNLAQEGIESGRQIRDSNLIDGNENTNWNYFVCSTSSPSKPTNGSIYILSENNCYGAARITLIPKIPNSAGETIQIGGTTYTRKIHFLAAGINPPVKDSNNFDITPANAIRMIVDIDWIDSGSSHHIELTELFTNWKRGL